MSQFRTEIVPKQPFRQPLDRPVLSIGSCFATEMTERLQQYRLPVLGNPNGILYNPMSIAQTLDRIVSRRRYTENDLVQGDGLWFSFDYHGEFARANREDCLVAVNQALTEAVRFWESCGSLILTFGTSFGFRLKETGQFVANCHKQPSERFSRELITHGQSAYVYKDLLERLTSEKEDLKVVVTVSPVRHLRDDPVENQISKCHLILLCYDLVSRFENVRYFPAYEIMMDDLRDYRFYKEDMTHPAKSALSYIWGKFRDWYFEPDGMEYFHAMDVVLKRLKHRPRQPESLEYHRFCENTQSQMKSLMERYSFLEF